MSLFLLVWIIGAGYALLGALCVSELAAMRPRSGGLYPLVHDALGPFAGFLSGWTDWIGTCCSMAAVAIVVVVSSMVSANPPVRRATGMVP